MQGGVGRAWGRGRSYLVKRRDVHALHASMCALAPCMPGRTRGESGWRSGRHIELPGSGGLRGPHTRQGL